VLNNTSTFAPCVRSWKTPIILSVSYLSPTPPPSLQVYSVDIHLLGKGQFYGISHLPDFDIYLFIFLLLPIVSRFTVLSTLATCRFSLCLHPVRPCSRTRRPSSNKIHSYYIISLSWSRFRPISPYNCPMSLGYSLLWLPYPSISMSRIPTVILCPYAEILKKWVG
jgi:hypothetical protein